MSYKEVENYIMEQVKAGYENEEIEIDFTDICGIKELQEFERKTYFDIYKGEKEGHWYLTNQYQNCYDEARRLTEQFEEYIMLYDGYKNVHVIPMVIIKENICKPALIIKKWVDNIEELMDLPIEVFRYTNIEKRVVITKDNLNEKRMLELLGFTDIQIEQIKYIMA